MLEWPELETLLEECRSANEERWRQAEELSTQLAQLRPSLDIISRQYTELRILAALEAINARLLGGLGSIEILHGAGIEYVVGLAWPPAADPRASAEDAARDGVNRIDVWLGLGMEDGRPRIRIQGEKRLEAPLPTTPERFRSALLAVLRAPRFIARPQAEAEPGGDDEDEGRTSASHPPASEHESAHAAADVEQGAQPKQTDTGAEPNREPAPAELGSPEKQKPASAPDTPIAMGPPSPP